MNTESSIIIPVEMTGLRLDQSLAELFPDYSRSKLQSWLKSGHILINNQTEKPRTRVKGGEMIILREPEEKTINDLPQDIPLPIVYEDEAILVIDKPAGLVVHPGAGNENGTLLNAVLNHCPQLERIARAGIVHRLDKDTSGLLVIAKTLESQTDLVRQLQERKFLREYEAVIVGVPVCGEKIETLMGRHPVQRIKMAVLKEHNRNGKIAITHFKVEEKYQMHSKIAVKLETGRTHQIRVHMAYKNYPLVGDPLYGSRLRTPSQSSDELKQCLSGFKRQALHARKLGLKNPLNDEWMQWESPAPEDMQKLARLLQQHKNDFQR